MVSYKNAVSASARHTKVLILVVMEDGLVPYTKSLLGIVKKCVLILVVMEDGLVHENGNEDKAKQHYVLILVVMEDGLVLQKVQQLLSSSKYVS